jgi:O-antigen/teichoic acid export membrane protein
MALYRQLDVTMIALLRPDFEIQNAEYGFVLRMVEMGYVIPTFLLNSVLPTLSERDGRGEDTRELLGKTLIVLLLLGVIAALFCIFWSRPLVQLLTTDAYLSTPERFGSDTALMLMGLPVFLNGLVQYGFYVLLNRGRSKPLVVMLGLAAIVSIGLNFILIPTYGYIGATITSNIIHIFLAVALMTAALQTMPAKLPLQSLIKILLFACVLGTGLWQAAPFLKSEIPTVMGLIAATIGMGIIMFLLRIHTIFLSKKI